MENKRKIILIFGLPGVGKTYLINKFLQQFNTEWKRLSGGDLLLQNVSESERDYLRDNRVSQIQFNQKVIISNYKIEIAKDFNTHILFDGHCMILTKTGEYYAIPIEIIREFSPTHIVYIDSDEKTILNRRKNDSQRPEREQETLKEISLRTESSIKLCEDYSQKLKIPFIYLKDPTIGQFSDSLVDNKCT